METKIIIDTTSYDLIRNAYDDTVQAVPRILIARNSKGISLSRVQNLERTRDVSVYIKSEADVLNLNIPDFMSHNMSQYFRTIHGKDIVTDCSHFVHHVLGVEIDMSNITNNWNIEKYTDLRSLSLGDVLVMGRFDPITGNPQLLHWAINIGQINESDDDTYFISKLGINGDIAVATLQQLSMIGYGYFLYRLTKLIEN